MRARLRKHAHITEADEKAARMPSPIPLCPQCLWVHTDEHRTFCTHERGRGESFNTIEIWSPVYECRLFERAYEVGM